MLVCSLMKSGLLRAVRAHQQHQRVHALHFGGVRIDPIDQIAVEIGFGQLCAVLGTQMAAQVHAQVTIAFVPPFVVDVKRVSRVGRRDRMGLGRLSS